jgi:hypothetical protein
VSARLSIDLPDDQYRTVQRIARHRGIEAHILIEQLVHHALRSSPAEARRHLLNEIRRLHATGRNDRLIAENLGMPRSTVTQLRNELKLPANDPRGRKPKPKESK